MESPNNSQILADRLRSHRLETKKARRQTDFGPVRHDYEEDASDLFLAEANASDSRLDPKTLRRLSMGTTSNFRLTDSAERKRQPGIREMDEKLQKLERLNFDLKMEVFHRREREEKLQQQVEGLHRQLQVAAKLQEEHAILLRTNKALSTELDTSSEAIDQAVRMICDLEAKVEELEQRGLVRSQSTSYADSGYASSTVPIPNVTPPTPRKRVSVETVSTIQVRNSKRDAPRKRVPSFMNNPAAENLALREAYGSAPRNLKQAQSFVSMFSRAEEDNTERLHYLPSPPLSALSESDLASVYKASAVSDEIVTATETTPRANRLASPELQDSLKRINKWMELEPSRARIDEPSVRTVKRTLAPPDNRPSTTETSDTATRPSTSGSHPSPGFLGWPDGGSIVTGTPSRFRTSIGPGSTTTGRSNATPDLPVSPTPYRQPQTKRLSLAGRLFDKLSLGGSHAAKPDRGRAGLSRSSTAADLTPAAEKRKSRRPASLSRDGAQVAWERGK